MYPGREWKTNFAGFYNDYDPRTRPWYIAATGGPKDIVIILDCSLSMKGEKFSIAQVCPHALVARASVCTSCRILSGCSVYFTLHTFLVFCTLYVAYFLYWLFNFSLRIKYTYLLSYFFNLIYYK